MKKFIAGFKTFLIAIWTILIATIQSLFLLIYKGKASYVLPRIWHKGMCKIIGLKVQIRGTPVHEKQLIYISNHLSYLDIPVIGSVLKASFIGKDDIAGWPIIGHLAKAQQTAFISRTSRNAKKVANALDVMLADGKSLILFPEGTSSTGETVLPFKSSLFSIAQPKNLPVIPIQPFIIDLIDADGKPLTPQTRDYYAWYADMEFAPHIWIFMQTKGATVRLTFLDVITPKEGQDRKELCRIVEEQISSGLNRP
ncbi:MAG: 1-acyl-sn-glycerol-3-phosphate acyltransferase [Alphaproteobacteria bacterium]|nr:1-acyl-sn-glycerol-3-phosphate acyltransferase [Alphaproteobacteria bacterium]